MRTGLLRNKVTIQEKSTTTNDMGESVVTWVDSVDIWCELKPMVSQAKEYFASSSAQTQSRIPFQIRMRYIPDLSVVNNRIVYEGRIIQIENILDTEERKRQLMVLGYEVQL